MSTWVFLRGLSREKQHWGPFPEIFRHAFPDSELVMLDLPGNGSDYRGKSPCSIEAMAEYCRAELKSRGLAPPFNVLTLSMGAMVAVAWAQRHPQELQCGVLISTSLRPFSPFYQRLRPHNYPSLLWHALQGGNTRAYQAAILRMTSNLAEDRDRIVTAWCEIQREHPVTVSNTLRQLWGASRYQAPLEKPIDRLLLLASRADQLVSPACSRQLADIWQADYVEHPQAGHDLPLDDGEWVVRQLGRWLQSRD